MKSNLFATLAVLSTICFHAFASFRGTEKIEDRQATIYLIYTGGAQNIIGNYVQVYTGPIPTCPGSVRLCAIKTTDTDGNFVISQSELTAVFNALDTDSDGTLDDQVESTVLLKKA